MGESVGQENPGPTARDALDRIVGTSLGDQLLAEVASKHRHRSADDVGDAFQEACSRALTRCPWRHERHVYGWLRRAMENLLRDQDRRERQEVVADTGGPAFERFADDRDEPPVELARREDRADLKRFQRSVGKLLSDRQRRVWALHINGTERRQVARVLGASERAVKKDLERIYSVSRDQVISRSGHGCPEGERLMVRLAFGLASASERVDANRHFIGCESCGCFYRRIVEWQEKVAVLLPPAAQADPALVERAVHKSVDALASLKQHVGSAGSQVKQQLADAAGQAKQHAAAGYTRTVEYTPLASVRPGAAATAIAGCLALGGGAAGYCIDKGVDPITGLVDVVQRSPARPSQEPPEEKPPAEQPPDPPQLATPAPTPPPPEPEPTPPAPAPEQPAAAPAPAPAPPAPPPPPPPEPTPPAIQFGEPATPAQSSPSTPAPSPQPAPAPQSGGTDLYGP